MTARLRVERASALDGHAWSWFASDEAQPYLRLFGQLHAVAGAPGSPHATFLRESVLDWLPTIEAGFVADGVEPATARELSTLTLAVVRGLLQDANAVGDWQRASAAFNRYAALLGGSRSCGGPSPSK